MSVAHLHGTESTPRLFRPDDQGKNDGSTVAAPALYHLFQTAGQGCGASVVPAREEGHTVLQPGTVAPAFQLPDQNGELVSLSDFRGQWVLLWWYPKASTPG